MSLPKPYYEQDGITIYCGDCREILPQLSLGNTIISDPPYGINFNHSGGVGRFNGQGVTRAARERGQKPIHGDGEPFDPRFLFGFNQVLLWGADHYYSRLPDSGRFLAWNKLGDMEPWDSFCDVEFAWHSREGASRIFSMKWKGIACEKQGEDNGLRVHPTQKPIRLMRWCITQCNTPTNIIDPYMGSGTTLVAARQVGSSAVGIEIDEDYCKAAVQRLSQGVLIPC
jgi:site-specific DNA-methyltransferase (adenine-specific)/modification methylase